MQHMLQLFAREPKVLKSHFLYAYAKFIYLNSLYLSNELELRENQPGIYFVRV